MRIFLSPLLFPSPSPHPRRGDPQFRHHRLHQGPGRGPVQGQPRDGGRAVRSGDGLRARARPAHGRGPWRHLVVQANIPWGGYPGENPGPVEVSVGTHELSNAWSLAPGAAIDRVTGLSFALSAQGSGRAEIAAADADQLNVSLVGTASAKLAGRAKKLTALVRGISALDGTDLVSTDASIGTEGAATVDAERQGRSDDRFVRARDHPADRPARCTLRTGSSATVSGCR